MAGTWDLNACPSPSSDPQQAAVETGAPSPGTPCFPNPAHPSSLALSICHQEGCLSPSCPMKAFLNYLDMTPMNVSFHKPFFPLASPWEVGR